MSDSDFVLPEHDLVTRALANLVKRKEHWRANFIYWSRMRAAGRYQWWERVKREAGEGLPMALELTSEVISERLKK